jgi:hypothetical protein
MVSFLHKNKYTFTGLKFFSAHLCKCVVFSKELTACLLKNEEADSVAVLSINGIILGHTMQSVHRSSQAHRSHSWHASMQYS